MSPDMRWRINVTNLATSIRIGVHAHEREPQRVIVNAAIDGMYAVRPQSLAECFSYENIHRLIVEEWPALPHTDLLETRVVDLLEHIFRSDQRILSARVKICKPDAFASAEAVGVEAEWTRADFERLSLLQY